MESCTEFDLALERLLTSARFEVLSKDGSFRIRGTCLKCEIETISATVIGETGKLKLEFCRCGGLTEFEKDTVVGKISRRQEYNELLELRTFLKEVILENLHECPSPFKKQVEGTPVKRA